MTLTSADLHNIKQLVEDVVEVKLDQRFSKFETRLDSKLDRRFETFEQKVDEKLDQRFEVFEQKLNVKLDQRFGDFETKLNTKMDDKIEKLAVAVSRGFSEMNTQFKELYDKIDLQSVRSDRLERDAKRTKRSLANVVDTEEWHALSDRVSKLETSVFNN